MSGVAGGDFEDGFGRGGRKGICVVAKEVAEVEGVGYGLGDRDGARRVTQWWGGLGGKDGKQYGFSGFGCVEGLVVVFVAGTESFSGSCSLTVAIAMSFSAQLYMIA